jgi:hypothetical protein
MLLLKILVRVSKVMRHHSLLHRSLELRLSMGVKDLIPLTLELIWPIHVRSLYMQVTSTVLESLLVSSYEGVSTCSELEMRLP